jgi:LysM repeat protein
MKTNTPNPLIPQGTLPDQRGKAHIRIAVFTILTVHLVLFTALLMAGGCKQKSTESTGDTNVLAPNIDSNLANFTSTPPSTSPPVVPTPIVPTPVVPTPVVPTPVIDTPPVANERVHTIVKNDSFYTLAKKYGVSMKAIADANPGVDSTKLKIGEKIKIPAATTPSPTTSSLTTTATDAPEKIYTVKSGDRLYNIAKNEGTTVKAIMALNGLKTTQIKVGTKLKIPVKAPAAPTTPAVAPGTPPDTAPTGATPVIPAVAPSGTLGTPGTP